MASDVVLIIRKRTVECCAKKISLQFFLQKFFNHEMTIEYARDKESTAPRQMRTGGRGGFSPRGRPPPRGSPFRGPPGHQRGPPSR